MQVTQFSFKVPTLFINLEGLANENDKPIECEGCNTFDVGSILDNSETVATIQRTYESENEAKAALEKFTQKPVMSNLNPVKSAVKSPRLKAVLNWLLTSNLAAKQKWLFFN